MGSVDGIGVDRLFDAEPCDSNARSSLERERVRGMRLRSMMVLLESSTS